MENATYWNYRVIKRRDGYHEIREVYYDSNDKPTSWIDATPVTGDDMEEIKADLASRLKATTRPVLTETDEGLV